MQQTERTGVLFCVVSSITGKLYHIFPTLRQKTRLYFIFFVNLLLFPGQDHPKMIQ